MYEGDSIIINCDLLQYGLYSFFFLKRRFIYDIGIAVAR